MVLVYSNVSGFNLFPKPAHKINAVLIFILLSKDLGKLDFNNNFKLSKTIIFTYSIVNHLPSIRNKF